jgi:NADH-quinone oxidoreductase subunit F
MDIRPINALPSQDERDAVDAVLFGGSPKHYSNSHSARGGAELRARRHLLLPALHAVNDRVGWISEGALAYICDRLKIAPAEAYGVATFYALFSLEPQPARMVHVCDDIACIANGADRTCAEMEASGVAWKRSPCLGMCDYAPARLITNAGKRAEQCNTGAPKIGGTSRWLLRRVGSANPESLDEYRAHDGYLALRRAIELGPEGVIAELNASKLVGRGGAAFPTGRKFDAVAKAPVHPHYLICNADESEPGTFKDRVLMEHDPYAIVEAMTIAAYATGCERGYVYIRGEYPLAFERLAHAAQEARKHGLLGNDVMGMGFAFDLELRRGAGAYICGEETALFNSIEGKRGEPRNKPPFPAQAGLFGKPTLVNNVETLACVPVVLREGGAAFAAIGTESSTGPKLFCVCGTVATAGLYEVPFGTTLRELIDLAGGVRDGKKLRTVLLGGAAGTFVSPGQLDVPLTFEGTRSIGSTLGSGVVMLFDESVDMTRIVHRIAEFFRDESCGQCVPCRVGTVRQEEALHRLAHAQADPARETALLNDIARAMRDASICGLGQTAANAVESALSLRLLSNGVTS